MRLWTIHPSYLDASGLVAAWREGLLAQKVLEGRTKGYAHHPQLERFKGSPRPLAAIAKYLNCLWAEAEGRGYSFDASRIRGFDAAYRGKIPVSSGQVRYEIELLRWKLERRSPGLAARLPEAGGKPELNRAFSERSGPIETWEKTIDEVLARLPRP